MMILHLGNSKDPTKILKPDKQIQQSSRIQNRHTIIHGFPMLTEKLVLTSLRKKNQKNKPIHNSLKKLKTLGKKPNQ
jgi:hypothetical protein